ncbi:class II aldolase/adducin family protein [Alkaliphilus metalliredigens QYMF]|uniref:Class II aldolase/adducin family protein n=1 Tax=Alkaliphilus metalliredigens (strain QYMF) TaxID=293826 RepID=A6TUK9_ALKMQ|nr:L-fuculose-phosphate aldolase [Alkaliphilus metalliredigens]ABR49877.1 class II aldolase/adducin family protein [Alkaliphilus metalliredigens QYMF]
MIFEKEREQIVAYGKKLIQSNLTKGTGGNISVYFREEQFMAITPSGIDYFKLNPEDIVVMDMDGKVVDGNQKPSSEYSMHKVFYERRTDINAVIHVHSTYATTLACMNWELPAVHYLVAISGGKNVRCAKYATFGTKELAENAYEAMEDRQAVLLANHGLLTGANDLPNAFNKAEEIEFCAEIYCRTRALGQPKILADEEMDKMLGLFQSYGQVKEKK